MVSAFIQWLKTLAEKAIAFFAGLLTGVRIGDLRRKNTELKKEASGARKNADIAAKPNLHGDDLIDGL